MSLITRCPACSTMFKVVPDQLRISEGWVRCGQCNEVFDANENIQALAANSAVDRDQQVPGLADGQPVGESVAPVLDEAAPESTAPQFGMVSAADGALPDETPPVPIFTDHPHTPQLGRADTVDYPREPVFDTDVSGNSADSTLAPLDESVHKPVEVMRQSFMQPAGTGSSRWASRPVRALLFIVCFVLTLALCGQILWHERDRLSASLPWSRPLLESLCATAGCTLAPFRYIEAVVIDNSAFTKIRSDVYRLSFTLKNTSPVPVATPAVELTLTDMQDHAVIRRVFLAHDFGDQSNEMPAGAEIQANLAMSVKLTATSEKISGYRLLSFYP